MEATYIVTFKYDEQIPTREQLDTLMRRAHLYLTDELFDLAKGNIDCCVPVIISNEDGVLV